MIGVGFNGCTINPAKHAAAGKAMEQVGTAYKQAMELTAKTYVINIEDGTMLITNPIQ